MANRRLIVEVVGDSRSLERALGRSSKATDKFGKDVGQAGRGVFAVSGLFSGLGRQVAFASSTFLGAAGLTKVLKDSVNAASNLAEQQSKVNVIFGTSGRTITEFAKTTATSIGIANDQALEAAGTFGNLFTTVGLAPAKNAALSKSLVQLAADLASFNNASPEETLAALRSGLVGEAEPLRRFGVLLTEARVQQEAMRETGKKNASGLTQQQKLLARYNLILRDTKVAQGDFSRTADGQANAQRALAAEIRDTEAAIGTALLPTIRDITRSLRDWLGEEKNQQRIQRDVKTLVKETTAVMKTLKQVTEDFTPIVKELGKAFQEIHGPLGKTIGFLAKIQHLQIEVAKGVGRTIGNVLGTRGGGIAGSSKPGQDVLDRQPGGSAAGAAARIAEVAAAKDLADTKTHLSLAAKLSRARLAVAKAALTKQQADDKAALQAEAAIIREQIASHKKQFRDKTALYNLLASVQGQIQSIDDAARQKQLDEQQKKEDAAKKAREKAKKAREKAAAAAKKAADKERAAEKKARDAALAAAKKASQEAHRAAQALRDLIQTERDRIGELFGGPVFNPSEAQQKQALGAPNRGANAKLLVADLKAQIAQFKNFERDLQKLARRGAPQQLLSELRSQGLAVAPQVHALAVSGAGTFAEFKRLFVQREQLAVKAARDERPVNIHLTVNVNKDTGAVHVVRTTPHGQKRGRNPGVIVQGGRVRGD